MEKANKGPEEANKGLEDKMKKANKGTEKANKGLEERMVRSTATEK